MRPLAGPAMLLVMVGGFAIYKFMGKDPTPPRAFTELELASADAEHTGTCYALSTVLVANGVFGNAVRTWSTPDEKNDDKWALTVENVQQVQEAPKVDFGTPPAQAPATPQPQAPQQPAPQQQPAPAGG